MDTSKKATLTSNCHCKAVRLTFPPPEKALNECLCSICRRYGVLWAYYKTDEVRVEGEPTEVYEWGNKNILFHRCKNCGCVTHWAPASKLDVIDANCHNKHNIVGTNCRNKRDIIGVNCRMLEREDVEKFEVKKSEGPKR